MHRGTHYECWPPATLRYLEAAGHEAFPPPAARLVQAAAPFEVGNPT